MQIVIEITKKLYNRYKEKDHIKRCDLDEFEKALDRCVILPKGHGRLIDVNEVVKIANKTKDLHGAIWNASTIIEADKEYEDEIITRGNCMMCGKELDEGLFFCKECEAKAESEEES